ncbi:MAG: AMP-binding protein, partial [Acidimicrobiia bacterium]
MPGGFWYYAQEDPSALAVVDPDGTEISAGELLARCNRMAHGLRSLGLGPGDTVAAILPNGLEPATVYLAALQIGLYYVPINYRLSPPEVAYILADSDASVFVTHERFADLAVAAADAAGIPAEGRLAVGAVPGFSDLEAFLAEQPDTNPPDRLAGAAMHYTSGT